MGQGGGRWKKPSSVPPAASGPSVLDSPCPTCSNRTQTGLRRPRDVWAGEGSEGGKDFIGAVFREVNLGATQLGSRETVQHQSQLEGFLEAEAEGRASDQRVQSALPP